MSKVYNFRKLTAAREAEIMTANDKSDLAHSAFAYRPLSPSLPAAVPVYCQSERKCNLPRVLQKINKRRRPGEFADELVEVRPQRWKLRCGTLPRIDVIESP